MAIDRGIGQFAADVVGASQSVLLELATALRVHRNALVLVGGWVPYFLIRKYWGSHADHVGSIDIDLAVDFRQVSEAEYRGIVALLRERGYSPKDDVSMPFEFIRVIPREGGLGPVEIAVDFLSGEYGGTARGHRHQRAGDLLARKARGCDVVFDHRWLLSLEGRLPLGAETQCDLWVADLVGCLTTKGIAMASRYKEKDAYDIYMVTCNHPSGPRGAAEEVAPNLRYPLVQEGLAGIRQHFASPQKTGPQWVADFYGETAGEARDRRVTDAYMRVSEFLRVLGLEK